ncbi:MAG TPA: cytochrome c biogenesis protein CcdA [Longimicrobiaceae bacterium]
MSESNSIGLAVAFAAGLLSFLSPCVLPLIPSYVTFITGMSLDELTAAEGRRRSRAVMVHGALFVLGFTLVFVAMGATATFLGSLFAYASRWVERVGGVLLILFGLYLVGLLRVPGMSREWRMQLGDKPLGYLGTVLVGVTFGAGWTPCIGPVLGGILTLAATRESVGDGVGLLFVYSVGLAIPFLAAALLLDRFLGGVRKMGPWYPWVSRVSGALLILLGVLLLTGSFTTLSGMLIQWTPDFLVDRL